MNDFSIFYRTGNVKESIDWKGEEEKMGREREIYFAGKEIMEVYIEPLEL